MRWFWFAMVALGTLTLAYLRPDLAFSPGELSHAHQKRTQTCQDCHLPFQGISQEACTSCHKPGSLAGKNRFHQQLQGKCTTCHSEHRGPQPAKARLEHVLLAPDLAKDCQSCHSAPQDPAHRQLPATLAPDCAACHGTQGFRPVHFVHSQLPPAQAAQCQTCHLAPSDQHHGKLTATMRQDCAACHGTQGFQPASFDHNRLPAVEAKECQTCHQAPKDRLHGKAGANCATCHGTQGFTPANFAHDRYFRFDRHHPQTCDNCHQNQDYASYSCYGCHEHSPGSIRREHQEEGIRNYEDCAACHASGNEHDIRRSRPGQPSKAGVEAAPRSWQGGGGGEDDDEDEEEEDDD